MLVTSDMRPPAYGIILAAGRGTRFGGEKLLAPALDRPLAAWAFDAVLAAVRAGSLAGVVAVVPRRHHALAMLADARGFAVATSAEDTPLSTSLAVGVAQLERQHPAGAAAAVVVLADQPALQPAAIVRLVERWHDTGAPALRARYGQDRDTPGHPVLLDRSLWGMASEITGDRGIAHVLAARGMEMAPVDVPGRNPDIDTENDLKAWLREVRE